MESLGQRDAHFRFYSTYTIELHIIFYKALTKSNEEDYLSTFLPEVSHTDLLMLALMMKVHRDGVISIPLLERLSNTFLCY